MKKYCLDLTVGSVERLSGKHVLLKLTQEDELPAMAPGQFVEVRVDDSPSTFLRRPISVNFVDRQLNELWLLVAEVGDGTRRLGRLRRGDVLNCLLPLGHGFTMPASADSQLLLIGGGVGVAPLLYFGQQFAERGGRPCFLLGARSAADLLQVDDFRRYGEVFITTEDGSLGEQGFVTNHTVLQTRCFQQISVCGPKPMMQAVARYAREHDIFCEVSLENEMACGLGACLCCVENTTEGHVCVCQEGPVLNIKTLLW